MSFVRRTGLLAYERNSNFADHIFVVIPSQKGIFCVHGIWIKPSLSSTGKKKTAQHAAAFRGQYAGRNFDTMVQLWMIQHRQHATAGPGFRIVRCIYELCNPSVQNGAGAHCARLQGHKQRASRSIRCQ